MVPGRVLKSFRGDDLGGRAIMDLVVDDIPASRGLAEAVRAWAAYFERKNIPFKVINHNDGYQHLWK